MKETCIFCQKFLARSPWCGYCTKAGCPANYGKIRCGDFKKAHPEKLKETLARIEFFKTHNPKKCDNFLFEFENITFE